MRMLYTNALYELAGINAVNMNCVVKKGELPQFVDACKALGVKGFDITMPHKTDIIPLCDEVDELSREFKCVNHVKIRDGKLIGIGLDGLGMRMAIEHSGVDLAGARVLMLGAGAVSGQIAAELCKGGAAKVVILNRTVSKAEQIALTLHRYFSNVETHAAAMTVESMREYASEMDVVVQCTNLGMSGETADYEDLSFIALLPKTATVADVIFNPERTKFLQAAEDAGLRVLNGMEMLVNQERAMMRFHFGVELDDRFEKEGEEALVIALAMRQLRSRYMKERERLK